jgi:cytochrome c biogenesis protein CcmG, thiol:disulfide interchange protein DsbE
MTHKIAVAASALFLMCCSGTRSPPPFEPASNESVVGRTVYDLNVKPLGTRKAVQLSEFQGRAVLLNIWASWCAPCKQELPMLDDAAERLRAKGVEIVAVSVDESTADAEEFLRSRPTWSVVFGHDPGGRSLRRRLEMTKMPTSFVIDRKGIIRAVYAESDRQDFRTIETQLIELGAAP